MDGIKTGEVDNQNGDQNESSHSRYYRDKKGPVDERVDGDAMAEINSRYLQSVMNVEAKL